MVWACLAEEQWHRRFSGHKAGPDRLPVHPPSRLPTSAGSWLRPMGLGERSEACASKGLGEAEALLGLGATVSSCPTLFSACEVVSAKKTRAQSKVIQPVIRCPMKLPPSNARDTHVFWETPSDFGAERSGHPCCI